MEQGFFKFAMRGGMRRIASIWLVVASSFIAFDAAASDGVIEINQTCAAVGCFSGRGPGSKRRHALPRRLLIGRSRPPPLLGRDIKSQSTTSVHTTRHPSRSGTSRLLGIPEEAKVEPADSDIDLDEEKKRAAADAKIQKRATQKFERALSLTADMENGLEAYRGCAACHTPEGWGLESGVTPQLAGQHRKVVIKQLADIRAGHRENRVMLPYPSPETIGGPQAVADVAGYIDTLEISIEAGPARLAKS